jgi:ribose-phosphate pyrophosphokinase
MDRVKAPTDVFTLKYFCETINDLDFAAVYIEDPHSNVSEALLDRVQVVSPQPHIETVIEKIADENLVMCYPDEGAMKRYSGMVSKPYSFGVKRRNWADGKIEGLDLMHPDVVAGKNVLIVDDICSRGGTFFHTAKALKDAGAEKIYLYVTHCEMTIFNGDLLSSGLVEKIYTTNSIFPSNAANEMIEII